MNKALLISGILVILWGVTYGHQFRDDYIFNQEADGYLKFHPIPVQWNEAVLRCHYEGAILASPINEKISKALSNIMMYKGVIEAPIFTGISNVYAESEYQSMEGVPLSDIYLRWSAEPNVTPRKVNSTDANCIGMFANGTATAGPCEARHSFVCYRERGDIKVNKCGTLDPAYVEVKETGSCYKVSEERRTWSEAFKSCAVQGAHLAVINSQAEAKVLFELSNNSLPKRNKNDFPIIGFRAWDQKRTWITVQGQSLVEAGYSKWCESTKEPNDYNGEEACGAIILKNVSHGILNDIPCDNYTSYYICEIEQKFQFEFTFL